MDRVIKKLRKQAHLSQQDVAKACGVGQSAVSHWEKGDVLPSVDKLPKLASVLGVTEQVLFDALRGSAEVPGPSGRDDPVTAAARNASTTEPTSPYLRSLQDALINARPFANGAAHAGAAATVPLITLGRALAGEFADEVLLGKNVEVPSSVVRKHPSAEAVEVEGNCMNRVAPEGTIMVFDPGIQPTNGRIAIVETEDFEPIIRRWHRGTNTVQLYADSYQHFDDIIVDAARPMRVLGTVVHVVTPQNML